MLLAGPVMAEDFGKSRTQPKPSPLFEAANPENEGPAANSGRFATGHLLDSVVSSLNRSRTCPAQPAPSRLSVRA
jgi:hypothetical protein